MKSKPIILLLALIFLTNCNQPKSETKDTQALSTDTAQDRSIQSISALYYNHIFVTKTEIFPEDLRLFVPTFEKDYKGVLDATIDTPKVLEEIKDLIGQLKPDSNSIQLIDARITAIVKYKNGDQDNLFLNGQYSEQIFLNGVPQQPNNRLLYLLKNNIGYYPWMIGDGLFHMHELQDNSFMKEPFLSSEYYKKWQKIRSEQ